jgi:hypothetical protein
MRESGGTFQWIFAGVGFFHGDLGVVAVVVDSKSAYRALAVIHHLQVRCRCVIIVSNNLCSVSLRGLAGIAVHEAKLAQN